MKDEKKESKWKDWGMDFLISVLGTAIGVGLTFAVSNMVENKQKAEAKRLTAMMVIDDMENSLETIEQIREDEEQRYTATQYILEHLQEIDNISYDTLTLLSNYIMDGSYLSTNLVFSESGEKVFQSAQDVWMNLNDISFVRYVDEFYKSRAMLKNAIQNHYVWQKPVSKAENDKMLTNTDVLDSWKKFNSYLKSKLVEPRTQRYIKQYSSRISFYDNIIDQWKQSIDKSKAMMHITDKEMQAFREEK